MLQNPSLAYSLVIPLKDEEDNIIPLIEEIEGVMQNIGKNWEVICVEDGSKDRTQEILKQLATSKPFLRLVIFSKNFGQSSAFDAGFKLARGEFVITLDGDRQNDPRDIPRLLEIAEHNDLVCGIRLNRKDNLVKKWTSKIANAIRSRLCQDGVQDTGCSLKVYRTSCLKHIKMFHGLHRFLPALFQIEGFRVAQIPVNHRERVKGVTKYNFLNRSFNTIADMLAVRWMRKRRLNYQIDRELP